jgi:hypothetical protein
MTQETQDPSAKVNGNSTSATTTKRPPAHARPTKALPTDRLKWDQQVNALKAIAVASNNGEKAVGADDIAPRLGIVPATAGLNNQFFMESGLIDRERKGLYKPTAEVNKFAQKHTFDPAGAGRELAGILRQTWYFQAVQTQLKMGTTTRDTMIRVLADAAGAVKAHEIKLASLLAWLEFAGLISTEGGTVEITADAPKGEAPDTETPGAGEGNEDGKPPADPEGKRTTESGGHQDPDPPPKAEPVLSFSFDFGLTAADLKELSPEQIQAVFEAVGKVAAVKATIKT